MFAFEENYKDSIYEFDKTEKVFKKPFSIFSYFHFDKKESSEILIRSFKKNSLFSDGFSFGRILYNDKGVTLLQHDYLKAFPILLNSLVGDKFEWMEINEINLLKAIVLNNNQIEAKKDYVRSKVPFEKNIVKIHEYSNLLNDEFRTLTSSIINLETESEILMERACEHDNICVLFFEKIIKNKAPLFFDYSGIKENNILIQIPSDFDNKHLIEMFLSQLLSEKSDIETIAIKSSEKNNFIAKEIIMTF